MNYDFIIIGGGVIGCAVADRLARFDVSVLLLEGEDDVASGASRANSGIVHAGYDCEPGTLKAAFNVRGNALMWELVRELRVPHRKCGSIVAAPDGGLAGLEELKRKGDANGVECQILSREETLAIEPNVSDAVRFSLYAKEAGVVSPYKLTIALADRAVLNGAKIRTEARVDQIRRESDAYLVSTSAGEFRGKAIVNCAGGAAARINEAAGAEHYDTEFRRGDYFVLDSTECENVSTVIFPLPTKAGKGILVAPTADGNVLYGPTSVETTEGDTAVTADALDEIRRNVPLTYKRPAFGKCIRVYAGVRAAVGKDFVVERSKKVPDFITAAGICSPGLTSAPAIAEYIVKLAAEIHPLTLKAGFITEPPHKPRLGELSPEELNALIAKDPAWGRIVCRCEKVTEAEIVAAINSPLPAATVDAVKRRVRAGMGRCQGGFCATRVMELLSRETGLSMNDIRKGAGHSEIAVLAVKEADYEI